ncbi:MAG TPA: hypothetical protein VG297_22480 [Bryobacteraceae bacterium]|jgi:hypothetical protein|nr:hypothetical protein [Bryobacteraceae bacterium]
MTVDNDIKAKVIVKPPRIDDLSRCDCIAGTKFPNDSVLPDTQTEFELDHILRESAIRAKRRGLILISPCPPAFKSGSSSAGAVDSVPGEREQ